MHFPHVTQLNPCILSYTPKQCFTSLPGYVLPPLVGFRHHGGIELLAGHRTDYTRLAMGTAARVRQRELKTYNGRAQLLVVQMIQD